MKTILGIVLIIAGILGGLYVGGWLMFIQSIMQSCNAFDNHALTATIVGWTIVKCMFASFVGCVIGGIGVMLGGLCFVD